MLLAVLSACLVNADLYQARRALITDDDGDGVNELDGDCDDEDPDRFPGADELCDGIDQDCDEIADEDPADGGYPDDDDDGFGDPDGDRFCGGTDDARDCDDTDDDVHPGASETCDGVDQDCDGEVDEEPTDGTWYPDEDGDGYGDISALAVCEGDTQDASDCDDGDAAVNPLGVEDCDDVDDDCDGEIDDNPTEGAYFWPDADGDGQGALESEGTFRCDAAAGEVANADDCDDADAARYAGAVEVLDGVVNDCANSIGDDIDTSSAHVTILGVTEGDRAGSAIVAPGDFDGDGSSDLIAGASGAGEVYVWTGGLADGSFADAGLTIDAWDGVALAGGPDFDGDAGADVVMTVSGGVAVLDARASGAATAAVTIEGGATSLAWLTERSGDAALLVGGAGTAWVFGDGVGLASMEVTGLVGDAVVAGAGDLDFDGAEDLVVGDPAGSSVYVFDVGTDDVATGDATATITGEQEGDEAGAVVCGLGDYDADGQLDLVVGAPGLDDGRTDAGSIYVLFGPVRGTISLDSAGAWIAHGSANTRGGSGATCAGDVNADGYADLVDATPAGAVRGLSAGFANLYLGPRFGEIFVEDWDARVSGVTESGRFGTAALGGDLDGDGTPDIAAGGGDTEAGAVYLFYTSWH